MAAAPSSGWQTRFFERIRISVSLSSYLTVFFHKVLIGFLRNSRWSAFPITAFELQKVQKDGRNYDGYQSNFLDRLLQSRTRRSIPEGRKTHLGELHSSLHPSGR